MNKPLKIGVLFSTTGPYRSMGQDAWDGAAAAIAGLRDRDGIAIEATFIDPHADLGAYLEGARQLLRSGCRHIVGTITSAARKEVIPLVEKHDGLLWYMCPYEGFEANESVIYLGGCPNQHLLPLFEHLMPRYGMRPYLVGANYVWGWEMNRLARELVAEAGGEVLGERYLPLEETAVERIIAEIAQRRPSFVLNNLIGPSSYAFLAAMKVLGAEEPAFLPENCPVVSCDLMECELADIPGGGGAGQLSVAAYFDSLDTEENRAFKTSVGAWLAPGRRISGMFASAYTAVDLCLGAVRWAGTDDPQAVRAKLCSKTWPSVLGSLTIDPDTHHAALPFHLGQINADRGFDVIASRPAIAADPYLAARHRRTQETADGRVSAHRLRIVS
jgi:branched-chain amino acid transport system substrate-binding protein